MGSRVLFELSQKLSGLLEDGLQEPDAARVPVFFGHPLDAIESAPADGQGLFGILYLHSVVPDLRLRQNGFETTATGSAASFEQPLHTPPLWVRAGYMFLLAGGGLEEQLVAFAGALRSLRDAGSVELTVDGDRVELDASDVSVADAPAEPSTYRLPVELVAEADGWRRIGLPEHRVTVSFEVPCPIASERFELVQRVHERSVVLEKGPSS